MPSAQLLRFGLEDRCRERGPLLEAMVRFELTRFCLQDSRSASWSYIALLNWGTGREADAASANSTVQGQSSFCQDESRPDNQ